MSDSQADSKHHKTKKHHKDEKVEQTRPERSGSKGDRDSHTARHLKLIQKWDGIIQSLKEADKCTSCVDSLSSLFQFNAWSRSFDLLKLFVANCLLPLSDFFVPSPPLFT